MRTIGHRCCGTGRGSAGGRIALVAAVLIGMGISALSLANAQAKEPDDGDPDAAGALEEGTSSPPAVAAARNHADEPAPGDWLPGAFSGSVALTSNYMYRGITQTDNDPAIQGTLEYELETGVLGTSVYIGTFASNTKLEGDNDTSHVEIDALFGIRGDIGETGLSWDVGGAYYAYPGTTRRDNFDYWEIPLILTYKATEWLEVQVADYYTPEYQFNTGTANYTSTLLTFTIPNAYVGLKAFGGIGYQYVDKSTSGTDWTLGTTVSIKGLDFTVAYVDTNYHARECGGNNQCDAKAIFTVGAEF